MAEIRETLQKKLGLLDVYAIATGATLSAGFFLLPGLAAIEAGPALVLAYVLAAVPLLPGILSKVELMTALPRAGGIYYFVDRSLGPLIGSIGGLGIWLVLMLKVAFALVGMGVYLEIFLPELPVVPVAVGLALVIGAVNVAGAEITGGLQIGLVVAILAVLGAFLGFGLPEVELSHFDGFLGAGGQSIFATTGLVFVSYAGLTKIAAVAEEVEDPERNLRRGVFLALATALVVYTAGTAVIVGVLPMEELKGDLASVASTGARVFGPWGAFLMAGGALLAFTAVTNAGTLSASRYPLAMSRDGILPPGLQELNDRGIPYRSVLATVAVMVAVIVLLDPMKIAKLASAFKLLVFALLCLAVIVMRESRIEEYDPGYLSPFYPWTQILGIVAPLALIVTMGWLSILFTLGLILATGLWYWRYARGSVVREGAVYHIFERLGKKRHEGLKHEFRQILKEKGLREEDPYLEMVADAYVRDLGEDRSFPDAVRVASRRLAQFVPSSSDRLTETFLEEIELGVTPVSHGAALLHTRLAGVDRPHLVLLRSVTGLRVRGEGEGEVTPSPGTGGEGGSGRGERPASAESVHAIFFLASPDDEPRQHLRMLAKLAGHVEEAGFLERWRAARGEQELKEILLKEERALALPIRAEGPTAELTERTLRDAAFPLEQLVVLLRRDDEVLDAEPDTELREGDRLVILGKPEIIEELRRTYGG